ncbi:hypothetical protein BDZ85DRAFT_260657 [Elsinoe ampelina]|uniref:Uncharacterized protein n=1 Tax=Elsinoe ampelina TaxID=302913 RepID=A0A6A6GF28_9PEZI|nr:hypothetical protein BDZ85DRAFT_260657 [Elsinoe ampelina]
MSADLFEAFGETEQQKWGSNSSTTTPQTPVQHQGWQAAQQAPVSADEEDDFGDFEGTNPWNEDYGSSAAQTQERSALNTIDESQWTSKPADLVAKDSDVLFDADEPDQTDTFNDEDFGDFESSGVTAATPAKTSVASGQSKAQSTALVDDLDLLSLNEAPPTPPKPKASKPTITSSIPPTRVVKKPMVQTKKPPPPKSPALPSATESWDDFTVTTPASPALTSDDTSSLSIPNLLPSMRLPPPSPSPLPPANIPPPSVLLPLFPPILTQIATILSSLLALSPNERQSHLLTTELHLLLSAHISLLQTIAHVIAARKLRWRRDKRLAQSMSIGPSVSGRSGGMKLTGLDKGEQGREEVEVREVVRAFKAHVGVVRGVVGQVNAAMNPAAVKEEKKPGGMGDLAELMSFGDGRDSKRDKTSAVEQRRRVLPSVPDIVDAMPVRTALRGEGAVVSTQPCGLCGMKREERVQKVDEGVEDSFGEWWIEGTNLHTGCWRFWEGFKDKLGQR